MTGPRVLYGTLTRLDPQGYQTVLTDDGETFFLSPFFDAAKGAKIGDRIKLEYRATPRMGLWYGSVADEENK